MKSRVKILVYPILMVGVLFSVANGCKKDDNAGSGETNVIFNPNLTYGTMTDQEGNVYKTITIGTQTCMAENLRTTKYNDGTSIPKITNYTEWDALTTGAFCTFNNTNDIGLIKIYGRLYNWYAVNTGKLAPLGWHVPTKDEWFTLIEYLDPDAVYENIDIDGEVSNVAGSFLKEIGTTHWKSSNADANNESGFTAIPRAQLVEDGNFGYRGYYWSSTEYDATRAYRPGIYSGDDSGVSLIDNGKTNEFPIRCVKNN